MAKIVLNSRYLGLFRRKYRILSNFTKNAISAFLCDFARFYKILRFFWAHMQAIKFHQRGHKIMRIRSNFIEIQANRNRQVSNRANFQYKLCFFCTFFGKAHQYLRNGQNLHFFHHFLSCCGFALEMMKFIYF